MPYLYEYDKETYSTLLASKVLAGACADLMTNPSLLAKAREEFDITAAEGYDCPLDKIVAAGPQ